MVFDSPGENATPSAFASSGFVMIGPFRLTETFSEAQAGCQPIKKSQCEHTAPFTGSEVVS